MARLPLPHRQLITDLRCRENLDGVLHQSLMTNLAVSLKDASNILNQDNPNNDRSACGKVDAFIMKVRTNDRHGMLTADQAGDLRTQAKDIRNEIF